MEEQQAGELVELLGHEFSDLSLLRQSLCHGSYPAENPDDPVRDNQRLEFLGDAVLSLSVSDMLMERFPEAAEGDLTRMRASLVSEARLAEVARGLCLGKHILLSRGENLCRGFDKPSILAGCLEAVIGAVYQDAGFGAAFRVVERLLGGLIQSLPDGLSAQDHKTHLQERSQALFQGAPRYEEVAEEGPDHDKTFFVRVTLPDGSFAEGSGRSKKAAAQDAAAKALQGLSEKEG
ncbi:MAG: ribonuclease III [Thermodesulfobacteriota bacterium]